MSKSAVEMLAADHAELQDLFNRVSQPDEDRASVLKQLVTRLSAHTAIEKELTTPDVRDRMSGDGKAIADRLKGYHDAVGAILVLIERRKVNSPDMPELVTQLLDLTREHIADADVSVLPALRNGCSSSELADLGRRMEAEEHKLLTHPHPHLPDRGPIAGLARKVASVIDRTRDQTADLNRPGD
jgi:hypothetical protein